MIAVWRIDRSATSSIASRRHWLTSPPRCNFAWTVVFRLVVFRPFEGEIIVGSIRRSIPQGIVGRSHRRLPLFRLATMLRSAYSHSCDFVVNVGTFFDDVFIPAEHLQAGTVLYVSVQLCRLFSVKIYSCLEFSSCLPDVHFCYPAAILMLKSLYGHSPNKNYGWKRIHGFGSRLFQTASQI